MHIREMGPRDADAWRERRGRLWSEDLNTDVDDFLAGRGHAVVAAFVLDRGDGEVGGFIELSRRSYAEGCDTAPVPYIEGWYVDTDLRRAGVGRRLVERAEEWARQNGHSEIASDCELMNRVSQVAHTRLGFEEVDRIVCFRKKL